MIAMRCPSCGELTSHQEELEVNLTFASHVLITGVISLMPICKTCGTAEIKLDIEVAAQVPAEHREEGHQLEISFTPEAPGSIFTGRPVTIECSCGAMEVPGTMIVRRS